MNDVMVVAEAGINPAGCLASAIELIDLARGAGADVVKFQIKTVELCTPQAEWDTPKATPWGTVEPYLAYRRKLEFDDAQYAEIARHCEATGITWTASVWDPVGLERLMRFDVPWIKVPSCHLTNHDLLHACVATGKPIMLSCGMSTEAEVDAAVAIVAHAPGASLMHCHSAYPAPDAEQSLALIPAMRERYGLPVGFSSHSVSPFVPLAAVSRYGAVAVETHFTKHGGRALPGSDQATSLEPPGLELLVREVRRLDVLGGDGVRRVWPSEAPSRRRLRGS